MEIKKVYKNSNNKFVVMDNATKQIIEFDYSVDAMEALGLKDESGNLRYSQVVVKREEYEKMVPVKHPNEDVDKMQSEQSDKYKSKTNEIKIVTKRPGRPKKEESAVEQVAEEKEEAQDVD